MYFRLLLALSLLGFLMTCGHRRLQNAHTYHVASVDNNVCKKLAGKVILYAVFVDSKHMRPWTEFDITSTLDSIRQSIAWLKKEAAARSIGLEIELVPHRNGWIYPIAGNLPDITLWSTVYSPVPSIGVPKLDRWADRLARTAALSLPKDTSRIVRTPNRITDKERLIARLRDLHQTDQVALMYFLNGYHHEDYSVALHTSSWETPEFAVVSYKRPAVIVHEFLHLFGAADLYISPFDRKPRQVKKKLALIRRYPHEVMAFAYRQQADLQINDLTEYLVGWRRELGEETRQQVLGKLKAAKY